MVSRQRRAFEEFAERASEEFGDSIRKLVLFGSVAGGEEGEESDIDVLVVVDDSGDKRKLHDLAFEVEVKYGVAISLFARTPEEYSEMEGSSFDREISRTGEAVV